MNFTIPPIFYSHVTAVILQELPVGFGDLRDHMEFYNGGEVVRVLDMLFKWKAEHPGGEVTITGGDVHVGFKAHITRDDGKSITQLVATPICQDRVSWLAEHLVSLFTESKIDGRYRVKTSDWTNDTNFGWIYYQRNQQGLQVTASVCHKKTNPMEKTLHID